MNRRSFLTGSVGLTLGNLLAGCAGQNRPVLTIRMLNGSIPPQLLNEFRNYLRQSSNPATLNFSPEPQIQTLFSLLQTWKQQKHPTNSFWDWIPFIGNSQGRTIPDLVTLGDYWLGQAIRQGLIQPLQPFNFNGWKSLAQAPWQTLVTRNQQGQPDPKGQVWAVPYRFGSTVIAYRQDIFKDRGLQPPEDWKDLWRPELRRQISLLDQPREVIGLVLKSLGASYNTADLKSVPELQAKLQALQPQVKLYSSDAYLQPLLLGDTWLAVGWSADVLPLMQRSQAIAAVIPKSGTALWADLWVRPSESTTAIPPLVSEWINFCWQPEIATQLSLLSKATSPIILEKNPISLPLELRSNPLLLPNRKTLEASEFLYPLPDQAITEHQRVWKRLRQAS